MGKIFIQVEFQNDYFDSQNLIKYFVSHLFINLMNRNFGEIKTLILKILKEIDLSTYQCISYYIILSFSFSYSCHIDDYLSYFEILIQVN